MKNHMPVRVITGSGVLEKNKEIFAKLGKKCLIVTSAHAGIASGAFGDLEKIFAESGTRYQVFDQIRENPTVVSCIEAGRCAAQFEADYIVGIGGGSVMDAAKTAAVVAANDGLDEDGIYALNWKNKPLPLILIGTTAGTGSEVTYVSVMTAKNGQKKSIHHDDLYARYAFGDPGYTESLPDKVRISTAIDALAHLLESYFNNNANDISRAYSYQGIRILYPELKKLQDKIELTAEDREKIYDASILGGLAINITGTVFCHTLGYYFTERHGLPHGFACALFTNDLIDYEMKEHEGYARELFDGLQIDAEELKQTVSGLLPDFAIQMSEEEIEAIMPRYTNNKSVKNTYGAMTPEDVRKVLEKLKKKD